MLTFSPDSSENPLSFFQRERLKRIAGTMPPKMPNLSASKSESNSGENS